MGKNQKDLELSFQERARIINKFGGIIPTSILSYDKSQTAIDYAAKNSYEEVKIQGPNSKHFKMSGQSVRRGALSRFPQNIGKILLAMYTEKGDTIYDPFAGHNSRMQLCYEMERSYIGVDICESFMQMNQEIAKNCKSLINTSTIELYCKSSDNVPEIQNNSCDFTLTSPPYYDLEYYGNEPQQLGKAKTYQEFLSNISKHIVENYRILKSNAYCAYNINDFKRGGVFVPYHIDIALIMQKTGFILKDIIIIDLGPNPLGACFATQIEKLKIFPKRHEYVVIGQK